LKEIIREDLGILKRLAQLLTDSVPMVRHSAAGALRFSSHDNLQQLRFDQNLTAIICECEI